MAVPLLALALLAAGAGALIRLDSAAGRRPRTSSLCWLAVPALALVAMAAWCALGLYRRGAGELVALDAAALLAGASALLRDRARGLLERAVPLPGWATRALLAAVALVACTALGFLALELPYNAAALSMAPGYVALECALVAGVLLFLLLLFQRSGAGLALGVAALWVAGTAQFFVAEFKGTAIIPSDLLALGTAATVSSGYVYAVDGPVVLGLSCALAACALGALVPPATRAAGRTRGFVVRAHLAAAAVTLVTLGGAMLVPSYEAAFGMTPNYWSILGSYCRWGMLSTFVTLVQNMPVDVPEGYTDTGAAALEASYVREYDETRGSSAARREAEDQFSHVQPSVVCIMDESFSDLSIYDGESWGYEGPSFYDNISGSLMGGSAAVSVLGAGTCNSEFEFLTGVAMPYVGDGKYPYQLYDLSEAPSLVKQFSALGYDTTAIHPNQPTNWNRDVIYQQLGFDEFLDSSDLPTQPALHKGVTDGVIYDRILEILESTSDPQFFFTVTMQNHGGYEPGGIPDELMLDYQVDGLDDTLNEELSVYLSCIANSDRDLEAFLTALRELDRPVVVVFFGDHQPHFASELNDALFPDEDPESAEHNARAYQTTYCVWANYDVEGNAQVAERRDAGVSSLAARMVEAIGAPLTDFQKAQLVACETIPSLSSVGATLADGTLVPLGSDEMPAAYDDLASITYLEFASKME